MIEIVLSGQLGDEQTGNASNGPTGDGASWSAEDRQSSLGNSGQEKRMGYHPSRLVARGALDVQTALRSCSGAIEGVGAEGKVVCLSLGKAEVPGLGYDELSAKVTLCFSSEAAFAERVGGTQQHVGEDGVLPASFVVATTLFDCAAEIKEADLRLYARCGGSNKMDTTLLCSAKRGAIGKLLRVGYMGKSVVLTVHWCDSHHPYGKDDGQNDDIAWWWLLFGVAPSQCK